MKTKSKRYIQAKNSIKKWYSDNNLNERSKLSWEKSISLLNEIKKEKVDSYRASLIFASKRNKKQNITGSLSLPFPFLNLKKKEKIIVIKENVSDEVQNKLSSDKVSFISVSDLTEKVWNKTKNKLFNTNWIYKLIISKELEEELKKDKIISSLKKYTIFTKEIEKEINKLLNSERIIKSDKDGNINVLIGNETTTGDQLKSNIKYLFNYLNSIKPKAWKGVFIREAFISTTFGPSLKIALN